MVRMRKSFLAQRYVDDIGAKSILLKISKYNVHRPAVWLVADLFHSCHWCLSPVKLMDSLQLARPKGKTSLPNDICHS